MTKTPVIMLLGTADTKADEILFMKECLVGQGAQVLIMDVGVLGDPTFEVDISKHDVANAVGMSNQQIADLGDENDAMIKTAEGATILVLGLVQDKKADGVIILGGTMGTDLALEVTCALPLGVPKVVVSTVSFSPLLPPERIAPDLMMILWAGGLYGLNSICKSSLSQACGAVLGAVRAVEAPKGDRPVVAISSLGKSSLKYMVTLKPELERRGFEVAIFHATGMGGRAMEFLVRQKKVVAVLDFALVEVSNQLMGSPVNAGADRMLAAGDAGIPYMAAPGGVDLIDAQAAQDIPVHLVGREFHQHNRLITCAMMTEDERAISARQITTRLAANAAKGSSTTLIVPHGGVDEWDREGGDLFDPAGLKALCKTLVETNDPAVELIETDAHINDPAFTDLALEVFDRWLEDGLVVAK
ncbi:MAG: Tm-1-like ATP-binding domain-containing protein [Alphaproteobacteria bacterium]|jgi:uncharacterized protein (UPF0261 family)|nr:Tm-1-like ATP-binding domain-containing protein [Alphaproteobacteria bacterium]MBT4019549.1 Tm-1-like ATP-binding domain-containing protein [Alphaproteobacteria bacterium]MBT5158926.1 Tm-1-like ATP-binding domain-containing protein [Alphaproteobacteria bacterium]MBT5919364.1 Tm-1-like ATP-binding domain-containing protein [Alphaproteobacteria bacterium]MBT6385046.1 Tm-1-like ATP-binding domain-containing protein [Alphaproteobacteria bacterium]